MKSDKTLTIMADFGFGPFAWLKDASDNTDYVGINIANRQTGMTEFDISPELEKNFIAWINEFELNSNRSDFNWDSFNKNGISLAEKLKAEIGDQANVEYVKPMEDPNHEINEKTRIFK